MPAYSEPIKLGIARRSDSEKHNFTVMLPIATLKKCITAAEQFYAKNPRELEYLDDQQNVQKREPTIMAWATMSAIRDIANATGKVSPADLKWIEPNVRSDK